MADWFSLKGRVALVTGASRGIGRAIALALGAAGAAVACCARSDDVHETAQEVRRAGSRADGFTLDVTHRAAIDRTVREVEAALGPVHILVNNAGMTLEKKTVEVTDE